MAHPRLLLAGAAAAAAGAAAAAAAPGLVAPPLRAPTSSDLAVRALALGDGLATCAFNATSGTFPGELLWQSFNTIEALSSLSVAVGQRERYITLFAAAFNGTPVVPDNCFDDHGWAGMAWLRVANATGDVAFLGRAAAIHAFTVQQGWDTSLCGGGVTWCPPPTQPYKNAITSELFLSLSAGLAGLDAFVGEPPGHFAGWAAAAASWLAGSGMVNGQGLLNDGLSPRKDGTCANNNGTTWTYNQGVLLDGLAAQGPASAALAERVATAAVALLSAPNGGPLTEPCGEACNNDQRIFKGSFVRGLHRLLTGGAPLTPAFTAAMGAFLAANVGALVNGGSCAGNATAGVWAPYGLEWGGPCAVRGVATASAALDLMVGALGAGVATAAAGGRAAPGGGVWPAVGQGACVDAAGRQMPACVGADVTEADCAAAAGRDPAAVAYDFTAPCDGSTVCRVRTRGGAGACPPGWAWAPGPATGVAGGDGGPLGLCAVAGAPAGE